MLKVTLFFSVIIQIIWFFFQHSTRAYEHSGFILRLILDGDKIKFEPDFPDFELVLLNVFDVMIKNVGTIPRVETKLYSEWVNFFFSLEIAMGTIIRKDQLKI